MEIPHGVVKLCSSEIRYDLLRKHRGGSCEPVKRAETFVNGRRVCAGNPGRVSCTMMISIFQSFLKL